MPKKKNERVNMEKDKLQELKEEHDRLRTEMQSTDSEIQKEEAAPQSTEEEPKKRRGRPKGSKNKPKGIEVAEFIPESVMILIIQAPYELASRKYGEHWKLSDEDAKKMVVPHMQLAARYLPDYFTNYPEIWAVVFCHALALIVRMQLQREIQKVEAERENRLENVIEPSDNDIGETRFGKVMFTEQTSNEQNTEPNL